ncbi:MAG: diguanylate cyclase [Pseudomonadales bacterium]
MIRHYIEIPTQMAQEAVADAKGIERVRQAIQQMQDEMALRGADNSAWDETYEFILSDPADESHRKFVDVNFTDYSLDVLEVDGAIFVSASGPVKFSYFNEKIRDRLNAGEEFSLPKIRVALSFLEDGRVDDEFISAGVTIENLGPMMYSASHIVTSNPPYPAPRGTLILFRLLDNEFFEQLGNNLQTKLEVVPLSDTENATENANLLSRMKATGDERLPRDKNDQLYWLLNDSEHHEMFLVKQKADARSFSESVLSISVLVGFASSAVVLILLALIFSRTVLRRLVEAKKTMQSIVATGDYARRLQSTEGDELDTVFTQFNLLLEHIQEQNQDLLQKNETLSELSEKDALTGIANRRLLETKLQEGWRQCQRAKSPLSVLMIDVDYFKPFNDNYGHPAGDDVLRALAQAMAQSLYRPCDFLARYGGEEFCAVLNDTDSEAAVQVAERLRIIIEKLSIRSDVSECAKVITASIGVATCFPGTTELDTNLVKSADEALYQAKSLGRNRVFMKRGDPKVLPIFGHSS